MAKIVVKARIPVTLHIDGAPVEATVARLTAEQWGAFTRGFRRTQMPQADFLLLKREPGEGWGIPDVEIRRRRRAAMSDEQRAEFEKLEREDEAFATTFLIDTIAAHLRLAPGQVEIADGDQVIDVVSGADFVRAFGSRQDVLLAALGAIARQGAAEPGPASPPAPAQIAAVQ